MRCKISDITSFKFYIITIKYDFILKILSTIERSCQIHPSLNFTIPFIHQRKYIYSTKFTTFNFTIFSQKRKGQFTKTLISFNYVYNNNS